MNPRDAARNDLKLVLEAVDDALLVRLLIAARTLNLGMELEGVLSEILAARQARSIGMENTQPRQVWRTQPDETA